MLSFFPRDVLDEIWDLIESFFSEEFPTYFFCCDSSLSYYVCCRECSVSFVITCLAFYSGDLNSCFAYFYRVKDNLKFDSLNKRPSKQNIIKLMFLLRIII